MATLAPRVVLTCAISVRTEMRTSRHAGNPTGPGKPASSKLKLARASALPRHQAAAAAAAPFRPATPDVDTQPIHASQAGASDANQGSMPYMPPARTPRANRDASDALRLLVDGGHPGALNSAPRTQQTALQLDPHALREHALRVTRDRLERSLSPQRERVSTTVTPSTASTSTRAASTTGTAKFKRGASGSALLVKVKKHGKSELPIDALAKSGTKAKAKVPDKKRKVAVNPKISASKDRATSWRKSNMRAKDKKTLGLGNLSKTGAKKRESKSEVSQNRRGDDHMKSFLSEIGNTGLLNKEQEIELTTLAQECIRIEQSQLDLMKEIGRMPSMPDLAAYVDMPVGELHEKMHKGQLAKRLMVEHNVRLAVHVARHYSNKGVPLGDLVQEGLTGLVRAMEKFDPKMGFRFSTYAHYWVRQGIVRAVSDQSRTIRLPAHVYDTLSKIRKARRELDDKTIDGPSDSAIAHYLGLTEAKVTQVLHASLPVIDLDSQAYSDPNKDDKEMSKLDSVEAEDSAVQLPESTCEMSFLLDDLEVALASLHPRERNILCMRYGLATADGSTMTLKDIGRTYGLTRERIRQIEEKALRKLRHPMCSVSLLDYLHVLSL